MLTPAPESPYRVDPKAGWKLAEASTEPPSGTPSKKELKKELENEVERLYELQRKLYADDRFSVLLVFQAMDAAGKDSTIRHVFSGVNPAGFQVSAFKKPTAEELDHDFLWRSARRLPERGRIGIFNRSYYEEVLVVRVHPAILYGQRLPPDTDRETVWRERYESIREHERHLARNGTVIVKFWLNVSREEQKKRFLARLDEPEKNWKFAAGDVRERGHWPKYMAAYEEAILATSEPWAPWYAIPADDKPFLRLTVAQTVRRTLEAMPIAYPAVDPEEAGQFSEMREQLEAESD